MFLCSFSWDLCFASLRNAIVGSHSNSMLGIWEAAMAVSTAAAPFYSLSFLCILPTPILGLSAWIQLPMSQDSLMFCFLPGFSLRWSGWSGNCLLGSWVRCPLVVSGMFMGALLPELNPGSHMEFLMPSGLSLLADRPSLERQVKKNALSFALVLAVRFLDFQTGKGMRLNAAPLPKLRPPWPVMLQRLSSLIWWTVAEIPSHRPRRLCPWYTMSELKELETLASLTHPSFKHIALLHIMFCMLGRE